MFLCRKIMISKVVRTFFLFIPQVYILHWFLKSIFRSWYVLFLVFSQQTVEALLESGYSLIREQELIMKSKLSKEYMKNMDDWNLDLCLIWYVILIIIPLSNIFEFVVFVAMNMYDCSFTLSAWNKQRKFLKWLTPW